MRQKLSISTLRNPHKFPGSTTGCLAQIRARVEKVCKPLDGPVDVIVNYDGAKIDEDVEDAYAAMVHWLEEEFYGTVTRYSGSAFMRMKLGQRVRRDTQPHIFETADEAKEFLERNRR